MRPNILMPIMTFMTRYYHSFNLFNRSVSVSPLHFSVFHLTLFALVAFLMNSCLEGPTKIGTGLLPGSDFVSIKSTDTISIRSYTVYNDSVRTDNPSVSYLGQIYDPYFGTTTAEFVSQIRMSAPWDGLPFTIDSVKLHLRLLNVKGGSDVAHTLTLSEIANEIYTDSAYYSYTNIPLTGYKVADIDLPALKPDTINNIVVSLPIDFGNYLTRDTTQLFYSNTKSDFRSFFKGLYFQISTSSDPMLVSLSLAQPAATNPYYNFFVLYMHGDSGTYKSISFILDAVNKNASFNRFTHDFNTASPDKKIQHINDGYRDTLTYLQNLNGVFTKITFPGLENLKKDASFKNFAINKARLIVPIYFDGDLYKASTVPSSLRLRYKDSHGNKYDVPDYSIDVTHSFFNGIIDSTANVYNFNIPSFVQIYLEDAADTIKPELEIFQGTTETKNVILKANNSKTPVKFDFTYTKF
jgi:hypothetical protein